MSIVRIGLAETKKFAEGYEAIFGKKKEEPKQEKEAKNKGKEEEGKKPGKKK
ncbi:MAG: hypothetical protein U0793_21235 [Gemmataceae bacterium]